MKLNLIFLLFCLISFMLSSCKDNPVDSSTDTGQIWPLKVGNQWVYHGVSYDSTGAVKGSGTASFSVESDTVVSEEIWYHVSNNGAGIYQTNRDDGLWIMINGSQTLLFKYPGSATDSWNYYGNSISILSTDTLVSTSLDTYTCYEYRISYNSQPVEDVYLCPGVGVVADDQYSSTSAGQVYRQNTASLISVTLK
jgi:hypothetical protein